MENKKLQEIINKYRNGKKFSGKNYFQDNKIFSSINSKQDVQHIQTILENTINTYSDKSYSVGQEDIIDLEKRVGEYEVAVSKAIQSYENTGNLGYSAEELQQLIDKVFHFHAEVAKIKLKKLYR